MDVARVRAFGAVAFEPVVYVAVNREPLVWIWNRDRVMQEENLPTVIGQHRSGEHGIEHAGRVVVPVVEHVP